MAGMPCVAIGRAGGMRHQAQSAGQGPARGAPRVGRLELEFLLLSSAFAVHTGG